MLHISLRYLWDKINAVCEKVSLRMLSDMVNILVVIFILESMKE